MSSKSKKGSRLDKIRERALTELDDRTEFLKKGFSSSATPTPWEQKKEHGGALSLGAKNDGNLHFIDDETRTMHMHLCGGTGKGKSTLIEYMVRQDIRAGRGVCLIDPHGGHPDNLYSNIIRWLEVSGYGESRTVHLIDPNDTRYTTGFNPLALRDGRAQSVVTETMLEALQAAWGDEDTLDKPRLRRVITATFSLLAEHNLTLAEADLLFDVADGQMLRETLGCNLKDKYSRTVWRDLTSMRPETFREHIEGPVNRLSEFTRSEAIRTMVGQNENVIDFRSAMDNGDIVLVNLQAGDAISSAGAKLLGTLIVRDLFEECRHRARPENPFFLYIDECHNFLSGDIPGILDGARKYGLHAILVHQRLAQLHEAGNNIYSAVMGSTEIKVVMGNLFIEEAKIIAEEIVPLNMEQPVQSLNSPTVVGYKTIELNTTSTTHTTGKGENTSVTESTGVSVGQSSGAGVFSTESHTQAHSQPVTTLNGDGTVTESFGAGATDGNSNFTGSSSSTSYSESQTRGVSSQTSRGTTHGISEAREAIFEERATSVHGMDKVLYAAAHRLQNLKRAEAVVAIGGDALFVKVPHIKQRNPDKTVSQIKAELFARSPSATPIEQATMNINKRSRELISSVVRSRDDSSSFDPWE